MALSASALAARVPLVREGVAAWDMGPPTPFWWPNASATGGGEMMVFESVRYCGGGGGTEYPPGSASSFSNASFFRVRRMRDGAVVGNVGGSAGHAYGSATVDPQSGRAWVFGSHCDLCARPRVHADNAIRAWWSDDLVAWRTTAPGAPPTANASSFPFNTRLTPVDRPIPGLSGAPGGVVDYVMAFDYGRLAVHRSPPSSAAPPIDLSTGWQVLEEDGYIGGFGAAPALHWSEDDGYFYVMSGGHVISLARSANLSSPWQRAAPRLFVAPRPAEDVAVSPFLGLAAQLRAHDPHGTLSSDLAHGACWDHNSNDADFCCGGRRTGGGAPLNRAWVFYSPSSQGKGPDANCSKVEPALSATAFNAVASANVSLNELLASYF
jgi:hypothetical protein